MPRRTARDKRPWHHVLDVYGVHLHLAQNKPQLRRLLKQLDYAITDPRDVACDAMTSTCYGPEGTYHVAFWVNAKQVMSQPGGRTANVVSHEAVHAAHAIFDHIHEDDRDSEPFAYLVGGIAEWLYNRLPDPAPPEKNLSSR